MDDNRKTALWQGIAAGAPFVLVVGPFGLLFGVVGTEAGLDIAQVMGFSVLVIAGAAQFTALQLMQEQAPTLVVLATALAVNLRMAMYSAALVPHLGQARLWQRAVMAYFLVDQTYATVHPHLQDRPALPLRARLAFYAGTVIPVAPLWYAATLAGALLGEAIPPAFALDFAVPITFLALVAPALRSLPHMLAAAVSVTLALLLAGMPYNLGLICAAIAAMAVGATTEAALERRR